MSHSFKQKFVSSLAALAAFAPGAHATPAARGVDVNSPSYYQHLGDCAYTVIKSVTPAGWKLEKPNRSDDQHSVTSGERFSQTMTGAYSGDYKAGISADIRPGGYLNVNAGSNETTQAFIDNFGADKKDMGQTHIALQGAVKGQQAEATEKLVETVFARTRACAAAWKP